MMAEVRSACRTDVSRTGWVMAQTVRPSGCPDRPAWAGRETLTAWFDSPVEAELSREVLDELAASLRMDAASS